MLSYTSVTGASHSVSQTQNWGLELSAPIGTSTHTQLTLAQHGFELCSSTYMWTFPVII